MDKLSSDTRVQRLKAPTVSLASFRSHKAQNVDNAYDTSYRTSTENTTLHTRSSTPLPMLPINVYPKYDIMFENSPKTYQVDFFPKHQPQRRAQKRGSYGSDLDRITMIDGVGRLEGGAVNVPKDCKLSRHVAITSECKLEAPGMFLFQPCTNVNVINVKLDDKNTDTTQFKQANCQYFYQEPKKKIMRIKTRGTQTLYRESSAQTLPYLPQAANDEEQLKNLEIFQLPTILPGDGPPGIYEVEVLERARKRWAFNKALKETFRRQLEQNKENIASKEKTILEAFEWERWMEREEYIQECQMLRLDMVIRMFEAREKNMHSASKSRIELSMEKIEAKRLADLRKNEIEYGRQIRRLDIKKRNQPRYWRKENIASQFGSPSSEFYAPQMRYGVNPSRRHFKADRKAFEDRMDDLEKKAVNMKGLVCPFAKLKRWSTPKSRLIEVEQNFCSDNNLKNLYESLKSLRLKSTKQKIIPKCLIEKTDFLGHVKSGHTLSIYEEPEEMINEEESDESKEEREAAMRKAEEECFRKQIAESRYRRTLLVQESHTEELEAMLAEYEGSTIGWMMKFLADESLRLQEQRKLHYLTMLAQRERWRREAAEAGLRQKENDLREIYEKIFHKTNDATIEVCTEYLQNALDVDTRDYADQKAVHNITQLAKTIDADIKRWLESFKSIQNPLNYETLRHVFKDLVFPNVSVLLQQYETELVIGSIIDDVLFPEVDRLLEPILISSDITEEMVDRLIDNDLYLFSDDSCSSVEDECPVQKKEAHAIIRKLIRRSIPGRRWMTPAERNTSECVSDILDDVFANVHIIETKKKVEQKEQEIDAAKRKKARKYHSPNELRSQDSHFKLNKSEFSTSREKISQLDSASPTSEVFIASKMLGPYRAADETPPETIYRKLSSADSYHHMDVERMWEYFECPFTKYGFQVPEWYQGYLDSKKELHSHTQQETVASDRSSEISQLEVIFKGSQPPPCKSIKERRSTDYLDTSSELSVREASVIEEEQAHSMASKERIAARIITEVIKSFVPAEGTEDIDEEEAGVEEDVEISLRSEEISEEDFEDDVAGALKYILRRVDDYIPDFPDLVEEAILDEFEEEEGEEGFVIDVNESEIELLNSKRCKCEAEKRRESFLSKMLAAGKVRIISQPKESEQEALSSEKYESIKSFEYVYTEENEDEEEGREVTFATTEKEIDRCDVVEDTGEVIALEAEEILDADEITEKIDETQEIEEVADERTETVENVNIEIVEASADAATTIIEESAPIETEPIVEAEVDVEGPFEAEIAAVAEAPDVVVEPVESINLIETEAAAAIIEKPGVVEEPVEAEAEAAVETATVLEAVDTAASVEAVENVDNADTIAPTDSQQIAETTKHEEE